MSYVAKYHATDGGTMLGGVKQSESSPFSHREDAEIALAASIEINRTANRLVSGEVVESTARALIVRHCPEGPAQAVGYVCPACRTLIPR